MSEINPTCGAATLEILQQYSRILNGAPEARSALAQDKDLPLCLVETLRENQDQKVIRIALEISFDLIICPGNVTKTIMRNTSDLKSVLISVKERFKNDANVDFICDSVLDELFPEHRTATRPVTILPGNSGHRTRIPRFLPSASRQQTKTLIFQSEAFGDLDVKQSIELSLLKVKGVVSIYFEQPTAIKPWRCIIRVWTTVLPQTIAATILSTERLSSVQHISKNEYGEEILNSFGTEEQKREETVRVPDKSSPLPAYLDENDDLIFGVVIGDRALTKYGENETGKSGGWLSGISSFLSKNLYW